MPSLKPKDGTPSQAEFGLMRAYLAQKGVSQAQLSAAIGDGTLTRAQIVERLKVFCQNLPKGT